MSAVASPPPAPSTPSAARADDLFALVKFVQSDEAQARLRELQEAETRAIAQGDAAQRAMAAAKQMTATLQTQVEAHNAAVETFAANTRDHGDRLAQRESALSAREAAVLQREDRCTTREREHQTVAAAAEADAIQREARLSQRERELDARIQAHDAERAAFERRRTAVDQAMRS